MILAAIQMGGLEGGDGDFVRAPHEGTEQSNAI